MRASTGRCLLSRSLLSGESSLSEVSVEVTRLEFSAYNDVVELLGRVCLFAEQGLFHQFVHVADREVDTQRKTDLRRSTRCNVC